MLVSSPRIAAKSCEFDFAPPSCSPRYVPNVTSAMLHATAPTGERSHWNTLQMDPPLSRARLLIPSSPRPVWYACTIVSNRSRDAALGCSSGITASLFHNPPPTPPLRARNPPPHPPVPSPVRTAPAAGSSENDRCAHSAQSDKSTPETEFRPETSSGAAESAKTLPAPGLRSAPDPRSASYKSCKAARGGVRITPLAFHHRHRALAASIPRRFPSAFSGRFR